MGALHRSSITLAQARDTIRRPVGHHGQTNSETHAGEVLRDVVTSLNNRRDWKFLHAVTSATVAAGSSTYTLPTTIKKVYGVQTTTNTLEYVSQREWDRIMSPSAPALGGTYVYTWFNAHETGVITLRDAVAAEDTITCNYIRMIQCPTQSASTFSEPSALMDYILCEGRARYAADTGGPDTVIQYWDAKAKEALAAAISEDTRQPDRSKQFLPAIVEARSGAGWRYDFESGVV